MRVVAQGIAALMALLALLEESEGARKILRSQQRLVGHQIIRKGSPPTKFIAGVPVLNYHLAYKNSNSSRRHQVAEMEEESWVVVLRPSTSDAQVDKLCRLSKACMRVGHPSQGGMPFFEVRESEDALGKLLTATDGRARFVEPDLVVRAIPEVVEEATVSSTALWGLDRIGARGGAGVGKGVHVYMLDTGIRATHQDFGGRALPTLDMSSGVEVECKGDFACAGDADGHGTHTAGTVAGNTYGVAPKAMVHAVKVLGDDGSGQISWSYTGLDWISTKGRRPAVASMSLGAFGNPNAMQVAVDTAMGAGVTVVVAAGNENDSACRYSPGFVPSAITVGSTTISDKRSSFSNYGSCTDLWAPGSGIASVGHTSDIAEDTLSGTSMACPHVSGGAAVLLSISPALSAVQVTKALLDSAEVGAISGLTASDTNRMLWVSGSPAPVPAPTPAPPPVPQCPDFAQMSMPDSDGDCECDIGETCSLNGQSGNCPTSGGNGAWGGGYFQYTCVDCRCIAPPPPMQCPDFARFPDPDDYGDCMCPGEEFCSTDGKSRNCPDSGGIGSWGGIYFLPSCSNCKCVPER